MGIFQRIGRVFRSVAEKILGKIEDPEDTLNRTIEDMQLQLVKAKRSVAASLADEKRLTLQLEAAKKKSREWEYRAELALREQDEALAKEALVQKQISDQIIEQINEQVLHYHTANEKLKTSLRSMVDKIEEGRRQKNLLIAQSRQNRTQRHIIESLSGLDNSSFSAFEKMKSQIESMQHENTALQEIAAETPEASLEQRFAAMEGKYKNKSADQLLEEFRHNLPEGAQGKDINHTIEKMKKELDQS